jgi:hypothetical protein
MWGQGFRPAAALSGGVLTLATYGATGAPSTDPH